MKKVIAPLLTCSLLVTIPSFALAEETTSEKTEEVSQTESLDKEVQEIVNEIDKKQDLDKESQALAEQEIEKLLKKGNEIVQERDARIQQAKSSQPQFSTMSATNGEFTHVIVRIYFEENLKYAKEIKASYDNLKKSDAVLAETIRASVFTHLVKPGGDWDLKQDKLLGYYPEYYFLGVPRTGEFIGNAHYGYTGTAVGYGPITLKSAGGLLQLIKLTSDATFNKSYFDDPKDTAAIGYGIAVYESGITFKR
ncbi:polymorphic toxin type 44 domain-containing protein [Priestia endophytica]|uniref:Bacterial toxin 44 domain-containing protein n=1 Tax=Priestia endophytica TaxID=135735 RepID=A0AAX1Q879_9BACI|nr:polymorphic toxin type 44 domain-containing protein [Priestia endophytica]RAS75504.1 hypothetical protein A3864_16045 [Priestia endophytica]